MCGPQWGVFSGAEGSTHKHEIVGVASDAEDKNDNKNGEEDGKNDGRGEDTDKEEYAINKE